MAKNDMIMVAAIVAAAVLGFKYLSSIVGGTDTVISSYTEKMTDYRNTLKDTSRRIESVAEFYNPFSIPYLYGEQVGSKSAPLSPAAYDQSLKVVSTLKQMGGYAQVFNPNIVGTSANIGINAASAFLRGAVTGAGRSKTGHVAVVDKPIRNDIIKLNGRKLSAVVDKSKYRIRK